MSEFNGLALEDVATVKAIISSYYGPQHAARFNNGNISDATIHQIALLLLETVDCSRWVDAVPNPKDLLMPAKNLQKWALRLVKNAGKAFANGAAEVSMACKHFRAAQFKPVILSTLKY